MIVLCVLEVEEDGVELAHVEQHRLAQLGPAFLITLKLSLELVVAEHKDRVLRDLALQLHTPSLSVVLLPRCAFYLPNVCQMLTANLNEVSDLKIWVFDAGATISNIDENALGCLKVLIFDSATDTEHEVGRLLLYLIVEVLTFLLAHLGDFLRPVEGEQAVHRHHVELLHLRLYSKRK